VLAAKFPKNFNPLLGWTVLVLCCVLWERAALTGLSLEDRSMCTAASGYRLTNRQSIRLAETDTIRNSPFVIFNDVTSRLPMVATYTVIPQSPECCDNHLLGCRPPAGAHKLC